MKPVTRKVIILLVAVVLIAVILALFRTHGDDAVAAFRTAAVTRGDVVVTISATGTVEPQEVVDVGAQVAGQILSFGKDVNGNTVDYGSRVAKGTILARIDDSLYATQVASDKAQLQAAKAGIELAEANLEQYRAKLHQADRDWRRAKKIGPSEALSQTSYDAYLSAYETAKANVGVGQAAILQAKAGLVEAQAALDRSVRNLGYCTITSPVKGVIIDRRVNIGQTVVSSLNAPSLFLIAKDLTHMQVWVAVNEADIGKIHPGQLVTFTVDAFPGETFRGSVGKVRLNASMTQNVVTYTVEVATNNQNGRLLPYLTANVQFELHHLDNVLRVPNAALRWTPASDQIAPKFRDMVQRVDAARSKARGGESGTNDTRASNGGLRRLLWAVDGNYVKPIPVSAGISDGTMTAVTGDGLTDGEKVVTGMTAQNSVESNTRNPFTPQFRRSSRKQSSRQ